MPSDQPTLGFSPFWFRHEEPLSLQRHRVSPSGSSAWRGGQGELQQAQTRESTADWKPDERQGREHHSGVCGARTAVF